MPRFKLYSQGGEWVSQPSPSSFPTDPRGARPALTINTDFLVAADAPSSPPALDDSFDPRYPHNTTISLIPTSNGDPHPLLNDEYFDYLKMIQNNIRLRDWDFISTVGNVEGAHYGQVQLPRRLEPPKPGALPARKRNIAFTCIFEGCRAVYRRGTSDTDDRRSKIRRHFNERHHVQLEDRHKGFMGRRRNMALVDQKQTSTPLGAKTNLTPSRRRTRSTGPKKSKVTTKVGRAKSNSAHGRACQPPFTRVSDVVSDMSKDPDNDFDMLPTEPDGSDVPMEANLSPLPPSSLPTNVEGDDSYLTHYSPPREFSTVSSNFGAYPSMYFATLAPPLPLLDQRHGQGQFTMDEWRVVPYPHYVRRVVCLRPPRPRSPSIPNSLERSQRDAWTTSELDMDPCFADGSRPTFSLQETGIDAQSTSASDLGASYVDDFRSVFVSRIIDGDTYLFPTEIETGGSCCDVSLVDNSDEPTVDPRLL